jgi:hypothetical protein
MGKQNNVRVRAPDLLVNLTYILFLVCYILLVHLSLDCLQD